MPKLPFDETSARRPGVQRLPAVMIGTILAFFLLVGAWLLGDLRRGHEKILADTALLATQRSQVIGQTFRTQILASDYVLRDVLGRIQARDLVYPDPDRAHAQRLANLLKEKADTVPDFFSMVLFDRDCVFCATATGRNLGGRSRQELCEDRKNHRGSGPLVTYVPGTKSASGRSVIVLSRNLTSPEGEFQGGIMGVIELERAQHWLESLAVGPSESVALLDDTRLLLARHPHVAGAIEKPATSMLIPGLLPPSAADPQSSIQWDMDGRERIFGFSRIEGFPFTVAYAFDKVKVLQPWKRRALELAVGYSMMLLLALLVARSHWKNLDLISQLKLALSEVQTLQGLIPICSYCKKIREDGGAWSQMELYISSRSRAKFSHGICPDCKAHAREELGIGRQPKQ